MISILFKTPNIQLLDCRVPNEDTHTSNVTVLPVSLQQNRNYFQDGIHRGNFFIKTAKTVAIPNANLQ